MRKIIFYAFILSISILRAQTPQGISYQAIAFDTNGEAVINQNISVKISILDNSATGTVVYSETHAKTTNAQGLFNLFIGKGTANVSTFSVINWGTNSKFLKVEIDPTGATNYTIAGTSQLMSVPYALYAENINTTSGALNQSLNDSKSTNFAFCDSNTNVVYAFNQATGTWVSQSGGSDNIIASNGNFAFSDSYTNVTYVFNQATGTWVSQNGGSATIVGSNGNFAFSDSYTNVVYAFNKATGTWVSQSGGSATIVGSNGNFAFSDSYTNVVYVFNQVTGTWVSQSGGSSTIIGSNGNFIFRDSYVDKTYVFNKQTGTWVGQNGGGNIVISESN